MAPFAHISGQFSSLFKSATRVELYRQAYADSIVATRELMANIPFPEHSCGRSYLANKELLIKDLNKAVNERDLDYKTYHDLAYGGLRLYTTGPYYDIANLAKGHPIEQQILNKLSIFLGHDITHTSPRSILAYALDNLNHVWGSLRDLQEWPKIPDYVFGHFINYAQSLEPYFNYFEGQMGMGEAFFTPRDQLSRLPQIRGRELPEYCKAVADAFALRFLGSYFYVSDKPISEKLNQNSVEIAIDPELADVELPVYLIGPKIIGDIKNCMRIVENREAMLFRHDANDPWRGLSLVKKSRGEEIAQPVHVKLTAKRLSPAIWEMRVSDNGRGIVVEELFQPLVRACKNHPGFVSPAIEQAVKRWSAGDPFAFNQIPLEDLFQAVYHLGVSTGTGEKGSGIGLWGSLLMLFKLGAQLKVGVTPQTGGFCESIILPVNLSVPPEEVADFAKNHWVNYSA